MPTHLKKMKLEEEKDNQGYNCNFQLNMGEQHSRKRNLIPPGDVRREKTNSSEHLVGCTGVKRCPSMPRTVH